MNKPIIFTKNDDEIKLMETDSNSTEDDIRFTLDVYADELIDEMSYLFKDLKDISLIRSALEMLTFRQYSEHYHYSCKTDTDEYLLNHDDFYSSRRRAITAITKLANKVGEKCERIEKAIDLIDDFEKNLTD